MRACVFPFQFSVGAIVERAIVSGDYSVATNARKGNGQYEIKLTNAKFDAKFQLIGFMETQQEIGAAAITCDQLESMYTDEGLVLKELKNENGESLRARDYYSNYLNNVIKDRLAKELAVSFTPLIAKYLEQKLHSAVLLPTVVVQLPQFIETVAPGVQVREIILIFNFAMNEKKKKMIITGQNLRNPVARLE